MAEQHSDIQTIQIDGSVILKIVKYGRDAQYGHIYGHVVQEDNNKQKLEITNCFPVADDSAVNQQVTDIMKNGLYDAQQSGYFVVSPYDIFFDKDMLASLTEMESNGTRTALIIYNPVLTVQQGNLALRVVRLSRALLALRGQFSVDVFREKNLTYQDIFEDVPFNVCNPALVHAYLFEFASGEHLSVAHNVLNPLPTSFIPTIVDTLTTSNPTATIGNNSSGLLEQYTSLVERYQRDLNSVNNRAKIDWERKVAEVERENATRPARGLALLPIPEKPNSNSNTTVELYLVAAHIKSLADHLSQITKLTLEKEHFAVSFLTQSEPTEVVVDGANEDEAQAH